MSPNPIQQITQSLGKLFRKSPSGGSVVGIDIGTSAIKVVQVREEHGRAVLETYGSVSLGPYADQAVGEVTALSPQDRAKALKAAFSEAGVTASQQALAIPAAASLIFVVSLPARIPRSEYDTVIPTEAQKYIPVSRSQVAMDWWPIPSRQDALAAYDDATGAAEPAANRPSDVLVAAVHNDTISAYNTIVKESIITPRFMEIEVFSTLRSTYTRDLSTFLLMDVGASKTKLVISEGGIIRSFHIVNRGGADVTRAISTALNVSFARAEEVKRDVGLSGSGQDPDISETVRTNLNFIFSEAASFVRNYEKKHHETIKQVVLTGGGALLPGFSEMAQEQFQAEVVYGNPFKKTQAPSFLESALSETGPEFAVAVGLAVKLLK